MLIFGSGVITVRAEKSTLFPIKFPLILPSFALSLLQIDLMGLPDLCVACSEIIDSEYKEVIMVKTDVGLLISINHRSNTEPKF